ncbi:glycoside hydrolase family 2 protein [Halorubrum lipolyticum]|uniref:Beta-galactosidase n=1 Tax=Halorubrum lipolyticum DSM 21995 TaxID=1227482 RepID=M0NPP6_9EURY|nr:sugar-binding domain-containing protein [Halorubrum lipolyticum]EMA59583.1 Beta-galactosidase [Halorubrum lipolyticum DSM 21995]
MNLNDSLKPVEGRSIRSLNGRWQLRRDAGDTGIDDEWYDDDEWPDDGDRFSVSVPSAWQETDELTDYTGVAWYRTSVDFDSVPDGQRAFLRFGAVDYHATVYVNGIECGDHRGGYLPFEVDVTDELEAGENVVTVRVDDPADISEIPHGKQGDPWYTRVSGIWQDVTLERRPSVRVSDITVTPDLDDDAARVEFATAVDGRTPEGLEATVRLERDGDLVAERDCHVDPDDATAVTVPVPDAVYWTPDRPALYDVEVTLSTDDGTVDTYADYFGMRSVSTADGELYLNGEPLYVRGALDQGYYPETLYRPFDDDLFEREIRTAKELGFNLLRKHIKPAHPDFIELADELGILVWEEPANPTRYTDRSKAEVRQQLRDLIDRDFNRPSVVAWSLYNEEWGIGHADDEPFVWEDEEKQAYLGEFYETAKRWDPTRLVCDNSGWAHVATDLNDYHRYFASPDRTAGWGKDLDSMVSHPEDNYAATYTDPESAPVLVSEFGTWGLSDIDALEAFYGGEPDWYNHPFLTASDGSVNERQVHLESNLRSPAGFDKRFEETALPTTFDGISELADVWQWREYHSVKDLIEQMRVHDGISGYVITEFSDIEWEFNGILDYRREEKAFHEEFAAINGELFVAAEPDSHVVWGGDEVTASVTVVNDGRDVHRGTVEWSLSADATGDTVDEGSFEVAADAHARSRSRAVTASTPRVETSGVYTLEVTFTSDASGDGDPATARNEEPVTVVEPARVPNREGTVFVEDNYVADRLIGSRHDVTRELTDEVDLAVVSTLDAGVEAFAEAGGDVLLLPRLREPTPADDLFEYRELPRGENWNLCSSLFAHDSPLISDLTGSKRLDWAFEGIYPNALVTGLDTDRDDIHVEYVEGWIANWGSPLLTRSVGDGRVCVTTFPLGQAYGEQPVGTALLDRLIDERARN